MDWYALFVAFGKEEVVSEWLQVCLPDLGALTLIPKRKLLERQQGKVRTVLKKLFPGYVLVNLEMDLVKYYMLKKIPNLVRILSSGEYYTRILPEEMDCIFRLLGKGDVIDFSKVYLEDSKVVAKSGPLFGMEGLIKNIDKRKKRVKIAFQFMGRDNQFDVGIEILN